MNKEYKLLPLIFLLFFSVNLLAQENVRTRNVNVSGEKNNEIKKKAMPSSMTSPKHRSKIASGKVVVKPETATTPTPRQKHENPERKFSTATKLPKTAHRKTTKEDLIVQIESLEKQILKLESSNEANKASQLEKLHKILEKKKNLLSKE